MRFLLLLCVLTGLLSGCRKKTSPEFYKLESAQSILLARDGDDAYVSAEMDTIITALQAIPEDALEKPRALELAATLAAGKARIAAQRVEKPKPPVVDAFAGRVFGVPTPVAQELPPPTEAVDAGDPEPYGGMDEATFERIYGKCFTKGPDGTAGRNLPATTKVLKDTAECQKRLGTPDATTVYLFVDGGVWGASVTRTVVRDAGVTVIPPPPPVIIERDAGAGGFIIPGAPLPDAYQPKPEPDAG